jgi:hypothetical protein
MEKIIFKKQISFILSAVILISSIFIAPIVANGEITFTGEEGMTVLLDGSNSKIRFDIDKTNIDNKRYANVTTSSVPGVSPFGNAFKYKIARNTDENIFEEAMVWIQPAAQMVDFQGVAYWVKLEGFANDITDIPFFILDGSESGRLRYDGKSTRYLIDKNKNLITLSGVGNTVPKNYEGWVVIPKTSFEKRDYDGTLRNSFGLVSEVRLGALDITGFEGTTIYMDNFGVYKNFDEFCETRIVQQVKSTLFSDDFSSAALNPKWQVIYESMERRPTDKPNIYPSIINNKLDFHGSAYLLGYTDTNAYAWNDYEVSANIFLRPWAVNVNETNTGVAGRINEAGTGYRFFYNARENRFVLTYSTKNQRYSHRWDYTDIPLDNVANTIFVAANESMNIGTHNYKINFSGKSINCYVDDQLAISYTELDTTRNTKGTIGLYTFAYAHESSFDDVLVTKQTQGDGSQIDGHVDGNDNFFMNIGNGGQSTDSIKDIAGATASVIDNLPKDAKQYEFIFTENTSNFISELPNKSIAFKTEYARAVVYHLDTTGLNDDTKLNLKIIDKDKDEFSVKPNENIYYLSDNKSGAVIKTIGNTLPLNFKGLVIIPIDSFAVSKTVVNDVLTYVERVSYEISSVKGLIGKSIKIDDIGVTNNFDNVYAKYAKAPIPPDGYVPAEQYTKYMNISNDGSNEQKALYSSNALVSVIDNKTPDGYGYRLQLGLSNADPSIATFDMSDPTVSDKGIVFYLKGWKNIGGVIEIFVNDKNGKICKVSENKEIYTINLNKNRIFNRVTGHFELLANFEGYLIIPFDSIEPVSPEEISQSGSSITLSVTDVSKLGAEPLYVDNFAYYSDFKNLVENYSTEKLLKDTTHTPNKDSNGQIVDDNIGMNITNGGGDLTLVLKPKAFDQFDGINTIVSAAQKSKDGLCYSVTPTTLVGTASFANAVFKMHTDNNYAKGKELLQNSQGFIIWMKAPETIKTDTLAFEFIENILDNKGNIVGREIFQIDSSEEFYMIGQNGKYTTQIGNFNLKKGWEGYVLLPYDKIKFKYEAYYGTETAKAANKIAYPSNGVMDSLDMTVLWWWPAFVNQENIPLYIDDLGSYKNIDQILAKYAPNGLEKFEISNIEYLYDPLAPNPNNYMKKPTNTLNTDNTMAKSKFFDYNNDSLIVRWNKMEGINKYLIYVFENVQNSTLYSTDGYLYVKTILASGDSCFINGLKPNTKYTFQVSGADDTGELVGGCFYSPVTMTTLAKSAVYFDKSSVRSYDETIYKETKETVKIPVVIKNEITVTPVIVDNRKPPVIKKRTVQIPGTDSPLIPILSIIGVLIIAGGILVYILSKRKRKNQSV